jgi:hypothetical protein
VVIWASTYSLVVHCENLPILLLMGLANVVLGLVYGLPEIWRYKKALRISAAGCVFDAFGLVGHRVLLYPVSIPE